MFRAKTIPDDINRAPIPIEIRGDKIKGTISIGFKTIGIPKIIGSFIQNNPGIRDNLAVLSIIVSFPVAFF